MAETTLESVDIREHSLKPSNFQLTERAMGIIALLLVIIFLAIIDENGNYFVLLMPIFVLIIFSREILNNP
ncbi:MAG: hypothetical protein ACFFD1_13490, partial [Candidatus Thorarchaeota archaeon]